MDEISKINLASSDHGDDKLEEMSSENPNKFAQNHKSNGRINTYFARFKKNMKFWKKLTKGQLRIIKIGVVVVGVLFTVLVVMLIDLAFRANRFKNDAQEVVASVNRKDIGGALDGVKESKESLASLKSSYNRISVFSFVPYFGNFIEDGKYGLEALESGFSAVDLILTRMEEMNSNGEISLDTTESPNSTQNKIDFALASLPAITNSYDEFGQYVEEIKVQVANIDPNHYPEEMFGRKIRGNIEDLVLLSNTASEIYKRGKSLLTAVPYLVGLNEEREYLVIFQNNNELRPTGGFITAYSIVKISKGKFESVGSYDIYDLDDKYEPVVPAPEPLIKYLKGPYEEIPNYRLRDMNWSPDFGESMQLFLEESQAAGVPDVDGVIAIDTQVLVNLLGVIGEIQVPGYGGYSNNIVELCDCEQIIYELEHFADREGPIVWSENEPGKIVFAPENYLERKKIIGPMMDAMVANLLGLPSSKMPELINAIYKSINEKHLLAYISDENAEKALSELGMTGSISDHGGDYLLVNVANLGGKKANLYVTEEVNQKIIIQEDGSLVKKLTITYKNPKPQDNWLNSVLPQYLRIYVPEGSELISVSGLEDQGEPYGEFGKTVFTGHMEVRPLGISQVVVEYKLPFKIENGKYSLYIQKQPGKKNSDHTVELGRKSEDFKLNTDKIIEINI